jgi:hypothetical protein
MQGEAEDNFLPGSSRVPFQSPLTARKGYTTHISRLQYQQNKPYLSNVAKVDASSKKEIKELLK